jgi:homoserine kinase type II
MMNHSEYEQMLAAWGLQFSAVDETAEIEGSPERTAARVVVADVNQQRWILERISDENIARKQAIAEQLQALSDSGLDQLHPYRKTVAGSFFHQQSMIRPFIDGVSLDRETYLEDSWRVDEMADFLVRFRGHSAGSSSEPFSIAAHAQNRMQVWRRSYPKLTQKLEGSIAALERDFFGLHDQLPRAFCHGDYHPLNMVWSADSIQSVIDWEFCGTKPELYDVALLLGCIGF